MFGGDSDAVVGDGEPPGVVVGFGRHQDMGCDVGGDEGEGVADEVGEDLAQFAYAASHDLAEPLRTITAFADLLQQRYRGRLDTDADDFLDFITSSATRMQQLIADMLAYSRVDTQAKPFTAVDAQQVFETVLADLNSRIDETGAIVRSRTLPVLNADRTQLAQVLANLIRNALTFVAADVTPQVLVWAEPDRSAWRFTVADNGIGIPPEHRQRVFGMFKRLHTRDVYSGTGVGLAIVQKVVQRHGGTIWIEDNPGGGSRLIFTIPRADPGPADPGHPHTPRPAATPTHWPPDETPFCPPWGKRGNPRLAPFAAADRELPALRPLLRQEWRGRGGSPGGTVRPSQSPRHRATSASTRTNPDTKERRLADRPAVIMG